MSSASSRAARGAAVAAVVLLWASTAHARGVQKACDVYRGFNFQKDQTARVGFLTVTSLGGAVANDLPVQNPARPDQTMRVFAVLHQASWDARPTGELVFTGQISKANKAAVEALVKAGDGAIDIVFKFEVYDYDPASKRYYRSFHSNGADLAGKVLVRGTGKPLSVGDVPNTRVPSPENYTFTVAVQPPGKAVDLHMAVSTTTRVASGWGGGTR